MNLFNCQTNLSYSTVCKGLKNVLRGLTLAFILQEIHICAQLLEKD